MSINKIGIILLSIIFLTGCDASFMTWKDVNEDWLAEKRGDLGGGDVIETQILPSGILIEKYHTGYGAIPKPTRDPSTDMSSLIRVRYTGWLVDGTKFDDNNDKKPEEIAFMELATTIDGWKEALSIMPQGSHWKIYIPAEKGYGEYGNKGSYSNFVVPPHSTLIFDIDLIDVKNY